jgi:hypothetical protein
MSGGRYSFFSSRHGAVSALRAFRAGTAPSEAAFSRYHACAILRELALGSRRGQRTELVALTTLLEPGLLANMLPSDRLLDELIRAVDRGQLLLVHGWGTTGSSAPSPARGHAAQQLAARAMGGAGELSFEGERYVVRDFASWSRLADPLFEALRPDVAQGVLTRLAARPRRSREQKAALAEVVTKLADRTKPDSLEAGLVLLRRVSFGVTNLPEEATAAATPSQLGKQAPKIEQDDKVDPVMDGGTVELDLAEVELPVDSDGAEDPDASDDDGAPADAEASEGGDEPETPEQSDDSSDGGP